AHSDPARLAREVITTHVLARDVFDVDAEERAVFEERRGVRDGRLRRLRRVGQCWLLRLCGRRGQGLRDGCDGGRGRRGRSHWGRRYNGRGRGRRRRLRGDGDGRRRYRGDDKTQQHFAFHRHEDLLRVFSARLHARARTRVPKFLDAPCDRAARVPNFG